MGRVYTTVSTKGQVVIPAALRQELGIEAGTRIAIHVEGSRLVLDPESTAARLRLIDELQGLTAGGPSMTDSLLAERRREREIELAKDGW